MNFSKLFSPALILSVGTLLSYMLGIVRDIFFARHYGATAITDSYFSAFLLSDIIMMIFISSALLGLVTPLFLQEREKNRENGYTLFGTFFASILTIFAGVSLFGIFFTPELLSLIFPALLEKTPETLIHLTRLFFISNFLFAISNFIGSFLMAHKHFLSTALSPLFYNLGIILGIIFFAEEYGIYGAGYGAVFGSMGYLGIRIWEYYASLSLSERFYPNYHWKSPQLKKLGYSMALRWLTVGAFQITLLAINAFSQTFENEEGLYSLFLFARNLESAPVMIFGFAIATASFQVLSQLFAEKKQNEVNTTFYTAIYKILFWTLPMAVGIYFLGSFLLSIIYSISQDSVQYATLHSFILILSISIPLESLSTLFIRTFNAQGDTSTPMKITGMQLGTLFTCIAFFYYCPFLFSPAMQIAISYFLAFLFSIFYGYFLLKKSKIIQLPPLHIIEAKGFFISSIASSIMAIFLYSTLTYYTDIFHTSSLFHIIIISLLAMLIFGGILGIYWKKKTFTYLKKML